MANNSQIVMENDNGFDLNTKVVLKGPDNVETTTTLAELKTIKGNVTDISINANVSDLDSPKFIAAVRKLMEAAKIPMKLNFIHNYFPKTPPTIAANGPETSSTLKNNEKVDSQSISETKAEKSPSVTNQSNTASCHSTPNGKIKITILTLKLIGLLALSVTETSCSFTARWHKRADPGLLICGLIAALMKGMPGVFVDRIRGGPILVEVVAENQNSLSEFFMNFYLKKLFNRLDIYLKNYLNRNRFSESEFKLDLVDIVDVKNVWLSDSELKEMKRKAVERTKNYVMTSTNNRAQDIVPPKLIIMGGLHPNGRKVVSFDTGTKQWTDMPELNGDTIGSSSAIVNNQVFIMGGHYSSTVERLILGEVNAQWEIQPPMKNIRWFASSAVLNDCIYTTGGYGEKDAEKEDDVVLSSGEFLRVRTNKRGRLPDMIEQRYQHILLAAQGKLFAIGGSNDKKECLNSSECFDFEKRRWSHISPMKYGVGSHGAVVLGDNIYVFGGLTSKGTVTSMMKYNISTDTWTECSPMKYNRRRHCAAVIGGRIYVVGGLNQNGPVTSIEVYVPANDRWIVIVEGTRVLDFATMVTV